jgi:hypothetical protein
MPHRAGTATATSSPTATKSSRAPHRRHRGAATEDPERCRRICAENARRLNNILAISVAGVELDNSGSSILDELANLGVTALGCLAGFELGSIFT